MLLPYRACPARNVSKEMASTISTTCSTVDLSIKTPPKDELEDNKPQHDTNTIDISITTELPSNTLQQPTTQPESTPVVQQLQSKPQALPFVYITPSKLPANSSSKPNNIITIPPIQIQNLGTNINKHSNLQSNITIPANISVQGSQGVILTKPQQLILQKPADGVPMFTMIKSFYKPPEQGKNNNNNKINLTKVKPENIQIAPKGLNASSGQKILLTPMHKVNPGKMKSHFVQPKLAIMPYPVRNNLNSKQKVLNLKIPDNLLQNNENNGSMVTIFCDKKDTKATVPKIEQIDLTKAPEDKTYQLSIVEDSKDGSYTVTIPEQTDKPKIQVDTPSISKETPKVPKHGVSILKRSLGLSDRSKLTTERPRNSLIISSVDNSITTISDADTKEVRITSASFDVETRVQPPAPKPEGRRRKSQYICRKDYDEVEFKTEMVENDVKPEIKSEKKIPNSNFDITKALIWDGNIGTLRGTELKFRMNEFGLLEYLIDQPNEKLNNVKDNTKENKKSDADEIQCLKCGCYGLLSDFVTSEYCGMECLSANSNATSDKDSKLHKKRKKGYVKKSFDDGRQEKELTPSDEDTSNDNSQDKYNYPWACSKKGFSWSKYLDHVKAKGAPVKLFKDPFPYSRNGFRPGMKLEGVDPQHPSYFCVFTVAEVMGYRLRLHFDGYPENYDFWINADSMDIFPAGWCEKYGHNLHPPPNYTMEDFNWNNYLKQTKSTAAPKQLFTNRLGNAICPNGFRIGMKLEAVDRKNTALVCVATVTDMMDNRILVHFDSWDDIYDYWADPTSPYIHPVGWCDQYGHNLTPPNGHPNPEAFTWETYLKEKKATAAPARAFKQRPANGFKRGMRLECVDKRVPQIIRVATVCDVRDHQVRISFDGWLDRYSYWVDDDSTDIHPIGWCHKTGHPLEPPLTPDDVYDFLECPTVGCRGQGHIQGPVYSTHSIQKYCPYAEENIDMEHSLPDRLVSPDRQLEAVVPVSREPREKIKPRLGRPPKIPRVEPVMKNDSSDEEEKKPKRKYVKKYMKEVKREVISPIAAKKRKIDITDLGEIIDPELRQSWEIHAKFLNKYVRAERDPRDWTEEEVYEFVTSLPSCRDHGDVFTEQKIDGEALLMLCQKDIIDVLSIKLGPAIKLYNIILLLRQCVACYT